MGKQKAAAVQRAAARQQARQQSASRRHRARHDPERSARLLIFAGIGALMLLVAGIIAFGYYQTKIAPLRRTVIKAGNVSVSFGHYQHRVRYLLDQNVTQSSSNIATIPQVVQRQMENEVVILAAAPGRDALPSEQDLDAYIRQQLGVPADADSSQFAAAYRGAVKSSGLSVSEYRQMMRSRLADSSLQNQFISQVGATAEQVRLRAITVATEDDAKKALDRIGAGEDFGAVATDVTTDTKAKTNGGEVDWSPKEGLAVAYADQAFSLPIGQVSDVISAQGSYFIIQVLERDPSRALTDAQKQKVGTKQYQDWVSQQRDEQNLKDTLDQTKMSDALVWAAKHLTAKPQPTPPVGVTPIIPTPLAPQSPAVPSDQQPGAAPPSDQGTPPADQGAPAPGGP